jgi:hypothetical protein
MLEIEVQCTARSDKHLCLAGPAIIQRSTEICVNSTARNLQEQLVEALAGLSGGEQRHVAHLLLLQILVALQQLCTSQTTHNEGFANTTQTAADAELYGSSKGVMR